MKSRSLSQANHPDSLRAAKLVNLYMQGDLTFRQIAALQNASINTVQGSLPTEQPNCGPF
jgi:DNA-binding CsgD family transcriptional regulator